MTNMKLQLTDKKASLEEDIALIVELLHLTKQELIMCDYLISIEADIDSSIEAAPLLYDDE